MKKNFLLIFLFFLTNTFSQFLIGSTLSEAKSEIKTYYKNIKITQDFIEQLNSITLKFVYMDSQILCYFKNNACNMQVIIPEKISAFNEWKRIFDKVLIKNGDDEWSQLTDYGNTKYEQIYYPKFDRNIFRITLEN